MTRISKLLLVSVLVFFIFGSLVYAYYGPRMRVASFTEKMAPIVEKDIEISTQLRDFIDSINIEANRLDLNKAPDRIRYMQLMAKEASELDRQRKRYNHLLKELNSLSSPKETKTLKKDFVDLNRFYVETLPRIRGLVDYARHIVLVADKFLSELKKWESEIEPYIIPLRSLRTFPRPLATRKASGKLLSRARESWRRPNLSSRDSKPQANWLTTSARS